MRENKTFAEITGAKVMTLAPVISANIFSLSVGKLVESLLADGHYILCNVTFVQ